MTNVLFVPLKLVGHLSLFSHPDGASFVALGSPRYASYRADYIALALRMAQRWHCEKTPENSYSPTICLPNILNRSYIVAICQLLPQLHQRRALPAFVLWSFFDSGHVGMVLQKFPDAAAQNTGAVAVNHAYALESGQECAVEVLL